MQCSTATAWNVNKQLHHEKSINKNANCLFGRTETWQQKIKTKKNGISPNKNVLRRTPTAILPTDEWTAN